MQELILSILSANTSLIQEKKNIQGGFQQTENELIQSQCRTWSLVWWESHTPQQQIADL